MPIVVDEMGLWVYSPSGFATKQARMGLYGSTRWVPFRLAEEAFLGFLGGVAEVLAAAEPVDNPRCEMVPISSSATDGVTATTRQSSPRPSTLRNIRTNIAAYESVR